MNFNKKHVLNFLVMFLMFSFVNISAQSEDKKARKYYAEGVELIDKYRRFEEGINKLKQAVERDPDFLFAHLKLGSTYKTLNMRNVYQTEIKYHYGKVATLEPDNGRYLTVYYDLADLYLKEGSYAISKSYLEVIKKYPGINKRVDINSKFITEKVDFALEGIKNPLPYTPVVMPKESINRYAFNSHPILTVDQSEMIISVRNAIGNRDENVVISKFEDGAWQQSESISDKINTPRNEGMATISGDGQSLVFTSCHRKDSYGGCDLYISYRNGEKWSVPDNIGPKINTFAKESEPTLSADGRTLYFSSIRKSGYGLNDIYITHKNDDGTWQQAKNMGSTINTARNEVTPFIHADGEHLYFASDGHIGFGGYDIFVSELVDTGMSNPVNIGYPLNTSSNEGSLYIAPDYSKGYFEKYEKNGVDSRSLIYEFDFPEKIRAEYVCKYLKGNVFDAVTKKPLSATVELTNINENKRSLFINSDSTSGAYIVVLKEGQEYATHIEKEGYLFHALNFNFTNEQNFDPLLLDIYLQPIIKDKQITLPNVFFETDKFVLTDKSKTELLKLINMLENNSELKLEISGHTDNIGSESYNKTLSNNRAKSVYDFLVKKSIDSTRLRYIGFGSSQPKSTNDTESGRLLNRRIEVKVL